MERCRCADGLCAAGVGDCEARLFTSSRTSASLLRMSSCRPWKEGTLHEKEKNIYIYILVCILLKFFHGCQVRVRFKSTRLGLCLPPHRVVQPNKASLFPMT